MLQVEDRHQYIILAVTEDHEGRYTCAAENVLGQTDLVSYLTVNNTQVSITVITCRPGWSTLIGPDPRDTLISLVEPTLLLMLAPRSMP